MTTEEHRPTLDYADPEMPRAGKPPDGYLGFRDDEPPEGRTFEWSTAIFAVASFVALVSLLLWLIGRWQARAWG